ncbi:MAG: ABC transporter permease subunit [Anaerolineales bacterium]
MRLNSNKASVVPFWRDERVLSFLGQAAFVALVLATGWLLYRNMNAGLAQQGTTMSWSFLNDVSGFDISETPIPYTRSSSYWEAFKVGLFNTLIVSVVGVALASALGVALGVARLSANFIVRNLAGLYIEIIRNVALLVFLVFWYLGVFLKLPRVKEAMFWPGGVILSNRGVGVPWGVPTESFPLYQNVLMGGVIFAALIYIGLKIYANRSGRAPLAFLWSLAAFVGAALLGWALLPQKPLALDFPYVKGLNLAGGKILSPEFMALTSGLVLYTAAFIAEIVRAGILSVNKGQVEAARALGLNGFQTLRFVVFPQALRVIVPPLTSQYLNLIKNSSLAVAVGYPDLFYVSSTILNQSGRAVEMISLVLATYLFFSLVTSLFMNWYNRKIKLVER